MKPSEPHRIMPDLTPAEYAIGRLNHALTDPRAYPIAYPILARYGYMERTSNGYVAIDPEAIVKRCRELIGKLTSGEIAA